MTHDIKYGAQAPLKYHTKFNLIQATQTRTRYQALTSQKLQKVMLNYVQDLRVVGFLCEAQPACASKCDSLTVAHSKQPAATVQTASRNSTNQTTSAFTRSTVQTASRN